MTWKPIKGYEHLYEVSDLGEIRSLDRRIKTNILHSTSRVIKGKPIKLNKKRNGYLTADLCKEGKVTTTLVHRIVAEAFIPNPKNLRFVNHIDSDRTNNRADNLEWVTSSENRKHGIEFGNVVFRQARPVICVDTGQVFEQAKIAAFWLIEQHPERTQGKPPVVAANIRTACKGRTPKAYGFTWKYHEGSTTIPKGSRAKRPEMGASAKADEDIV